MFLLRLLISKCWIWVPEAFWPIPCLLTLHSNCHMGLVLCCCCHVASSCYCLVKKLALTTINCFKWAFTHKLQIPYLFNLRGRVYWESSMEEIFCESSPQALFMRKHSWFNSYPPWVFSATEVMDTCRFVKFAKFFFCGWFPIYSNAIVV